VEALQTLINALVVTAVGILLARMTHNLRQEVRGDIAGLRGEMHTDKAELKGEIAGLRTELKGEIAGLRTELKSDIAGLRTELKSDIGGLRTEIHEVRSDITHVALALGAEGRSGPI
jgi:hypothetical protein